jgi:hypothetical protein
VFTGKVEHSFVGETEWRKIMTAEAKQWPRIGDMLRSTILGSTSIFDGRF